MRAAVRELGRRVVATAHTWRSRLSGARVGCVLVYHGVADETGDADREIVPAIAATLLESHVRLLSRRYRIVPPSAILDAVVRRRRGGRVPLALTFDDDLASHVTHAAPLLRRRGVPAGFFLCGSMVAGAGGYWWEHLQESVDAGRLRPDDLPGATAEQVDAALAREPGAISGLARIVEELDPAARVTATAALARHASPRRRLERDDVRSLVRDGFEVGFHTLRHDRLPPLDDARLEAAMSDGRRELEELAGVRLTTISYPHGRADARIGDAARAAGFTVGFVGGGARIGPGDEPLLLSRLSPTFETGGTVALEIARYLRRRTA